MLVLVSYDVSTVTPGGKRRLARVAKACVGFGLRVQYSVFECEVEPAQWVRLRNVLLDLIDPEQDSLRFYHLGAKWQRRVEQHGRRKAPDHHGLLEI